MSSFRTVVITTLLIGLVLTSMIYVMILFSDENETPIKITDEPIISETFGNISEELNTSGATASKQQSAFVEEGKKPIVSALGFIFNSITNLGSTFLGSTIRMFNFIGDFVTRVFEINPMITGSLSAILVIILILAAWRVYRLGE